MTSPRSQASAAGFTLIEMLVVLAVLGVLVGIVIERGPMRSARQTARAAAGELAQGLRVARSTAIERNRPVQLLVDLKAHSWRLGDRPPQPLPRELGIEMLTVRGEALDKTTPMIRFDPDGSSTGGRIALTGAGEKIEVGIDWLSGRVQVTELAGDHAR